MIIGNKFRTVLKIKSKEHLHDTILEQYDFWKMFGDLSHCILLDNNNKIQVQFDSIVDKHFLNLFYEDIEIKNRQLELGGFIEIIDSCNNRFNEKIIDFELINEACVKVYTINGRFYFKGKSFPTFDWNNKTRFKYKSHVNIVNYYYETV